MFEFTDSWDRRTVYSRAEPDDEYDQGEAPLEPYMGDMDDYDMEDESAEIFDQDEDED